MAAHKPRSLVRPPLSGLCMFVQTHPGNAPTNDHNRPREKKADPVLPRSACVDSTVRWPVDLL